MNVKVNKQFTATSRFARWENGRRSACAWLSGGWRDESGLGVCVEWSRICPKRVNPTVLQRAQGEAPRLQRQDQRHEPQLAEQEPQLIDMSELAFPPLRITTAPSPDDHAPEARRMEKLGEIAARTIELFSALPTTELDEMIRAVKAEIAQLETEAEEILKTHVAHTDRLAAAITRLAAGCGLAKDMLSKLRQQCAALPEHRPLLESGLIKVAERWDKGTQRMRR